MNRQETIELMKFISSKKVNYFKKYTNEQKKEMIDQWQTKFENNNYEDVKKEVEFYIQKNNKVPYPQHINASIDWDRLDDDSSNLWYKAFPQTEDFYYNDEDMRKATEIVGEDNWKIPEELRKRMHYRPDPSDEVRNELLKQALAAQQQN